MPVGDVFKDADVVRIDELRAAREHAVMRKVSGGSLFVVLSPCGSINLQPT
jgi:hypothetical protein